MFGSDQCWNRVWVGEFARASLLRFCVALLQGAATVVEHKYAVM